MDINDIRALLTVVLLVVFIGIWVWAWSDKRKPAFEEAARLPLEDETPAPGQKPEEVEP
ncbi:MAG: cbb3-type cytochrome c oxidase subunit 3 [Gammaproteobacteria bacterium]|nr:cbb3-type cytochrome c oxidase subunit 3 [Gammaproteobacteria bacterium]NIR97552.1 cbb3-type cytochrome c oxidase subunit 3 [Gammaproteobacteria bacterium]NIT63190.1 cbb3-type cytochrome c oxidase subunit 3 [Gammaproteobacteria bacterium]NIV20138.1 CcoQ/FixQ family Cbb3-type cytochrome c oxidase assembly chaperone [Gammaproteobacteria bacterium]NIX10474.1 CcoQ/FixQ family Cbb3-type cytochrome c oxidase assembly chaperone [Gammaproteobacteria bacterium]